MVKSYVLKENCATFDISTKKGNRRVQWEIRQDGCKSFSTEDIDVQMGIETMPSFGCKIWCGSGKPFTKEEIENYNNNFTEKEEVVVNEQKKEEDTSDFELIEGVTSVQKACAFFDARGIKYTKPVTAQKAKDIANENKILFVDYK